ncbi:MAG: MFS transporter [Candidatus Sulfotelmatobacter sp.]
MTPFPIHEESSHRIDDQAHSSPADVHPGMNRVVFLLSLSVLINYIDRSNLSIAAPLLQDELHISNTQLGTLLGAFFWVYALLQIPAGWLVDHFDVKWVFAGGFFLWSLATGVTGILHGFVALVVFRVILGIGESVAFPSFSKILSTYFTEAKRGFPNAMLMVGISLGPALGILIGGTVIGAFGWRPFFLVLGLGALLWLPLWLAWMPRSEPRTVIHTSSSGVGIKSILKQRSAWGTCLGQFSINYYLYFLVTWLPSYLKRERGLSLNDIGRDGFLLFVMSAIGAVIWGKLSDQWINAGATPTLVRKSALVGGSIGVGVFLMLTVMSQGVSFLAMLALTGTCLGVPCSTSWAVTQTLAGPVAAGRWAGVQNFVGNFAGWIAPILTGFLVDRTGQFWWAFFITAAVAWIGAVSWAFIVGPVEPVDWERVAARSLIPAAPAANASLP